MRLEAPRHLPREAIEREGSNHLRVPQVLYQFLILNNKEVDHRGGSMVIPDSDRVVARERRNSGLERHGREG